MNAPAKLEAPGPVLAVFQQLLGIARQELKMDVAWISEFVGGEQVIRATSGDESFPEIKEGFAAAYDGSYCKRVLEGKLPSVIPDARADSRTRALPVTERLGIGSYVGVPIPRPGGGVYGMLCAVSRGESSTPPPALRLLEALAMAAGEEAALRGAERASREAKRARIERTLAEKRFGIVLQPIVRLSNMQVIGAEALTRFVDAPARPDVWFADAADVALDEELELGVVEAALGLLPALAADVYLSVNASPRIAAGDALRRLVLASDPARVRLEITEQRAVTDYPALRAALAPLREAGVKVAVDDAGAGYASFSHILALAPDVIKLDVHLTRGLDHDPVRLSLAEALVSFATRMGATLVAEGVETQAELDALLRIGCYAVQGYFMARPRPLPLPSITATPSSPPNSSVGPAPADETSFRDFANRLLREVMAETGLDLAYMTVLHPENGMLEHRYVQPEDSPKLGRGLTIPWGDSLCVRAREAGLVWTADLEQDLAGGSPMAAGVETFMSVPIRTPANHLPMGTLCAVGFNRRYLSERTVSRVESIARRLADRVMRDGIGAFMKMLGPGAR